MTKHRWPHRGIRRNSRALANYQGREPERAGDWPTDLPDRFDVAFSFAGTEREHAEELANLVRAAGFRVFYDKFYESELWGKTPSRVLSRSL